jgi:hemerythrin
MGFRSSAPDIFFRDLPHILPIPADRLDNWLDVPLDVLKSPEAVACALTSGFCPQTGNTQAEGAPRRMHLMVWNDNMTVGVKAMDDDHKQLVDIVNELTEGIVSGQELTAVGFILERLILCTKDHLTREERLLAQNGYPVKKQHHKEHDLLIKKVLIAQANFRMGSTNVLADDVIAFLQDWLFGHIQGSDKEYGPFLNAKGID